MKLSFQACAFLLALAFSACGSPAMTQNRTIVARGPDFDQSFDAVQEAMREQSYLVAKADKASGHIQTEKRTERDYWWVIDAQVARDGGVEFSVSGSENVQQGDRVHRYLLNYVDFLKRTFQTVVARKQRVAS